MKKHINWRHRRVRLSDEQIQAQLIQSIQMQLQAYEAMREIARRHRNLFIADYEDLCNRYGCSKYLCFTQGQGGLKIMKNKKI